MVKFTLTFLLHVSFCYFMGRSDVSRCSATIKRTNRSSGNIVRGGEIHELAKSTILPKRNITDKVHATYPKLRKLLGMTIAPPHDGKGTCPDMESGTRKKFLSKFPVIYFNSVNSTILCTLYPEHAGILGSVTVDRKPHGVAGKMNAPGNYMFPYVHTYMCGHHEENYQLILYIIFSC